MTTLTTGDILFSTPWSGVTPRKTASTFAELETQIEEGLSLKTGVYPWFNVRTEAYGAACDDSTDDRSAIQAAIDAAEAAGGGYVLIPGKSRVSATLTINSEGVRLVGLGIMASHIKFTDDSTETGPLVEFTGTGFFDDCGIAHITLDGNKANVTGSEGCLYMQNCRLFRADDIRVMSSSGYGLWSTTTSTSGVSFVQNNMYTRIYSQNNDGNGQHYQSEKNSQWCMLRSDTDAQDGTDGTGGIVFEAGATTTNEETTEDCITNVRIDGSGRFGLILDAVTKYVISDVMLFDSDDSAIFLRNSNTDGAANSGIINYLTMNCFVLRNNATSGTFLGWSGIETDANNTQVSDIRLTGWAVNGSGQANAGPGVFDVRGWVRFGFVNAEAVSCKGTVWHVRTGELTDGSAVIPSNGVWSACIAQLNGNAAASANHGIHLENGTDFQIVGTRLDNSVTGDGTSYELLVESGVTNVQLGSGCSLQPNTAGGAISIESGAEDEVSIAADVVWEGDSSYVPTVAAAGTLTIPPTAYNKACTVTGTNNVTTVTTMPSGTRVTLIFTDATPGDLVHGNNIVLAGDANFSPATGDAITIVALGANVYQSGP